MPQLVGWVERSQTHLLLVNVGFHPLNATCYNGGNLRNAMAPQPTILKADS